MYNGALDSFMTLLILLGATPQAKSIEVTLTVTYSKGPYAGMLGSAATMECSWKTGKVDIPGQLIFFSSRRGPGSPLYTHIIGSLYSKRVAVNMSTWDSTRMSSLPVHTKTTQTSMTISGLICNDSDTYTCRIGYMKNGRAQKPAEDSVELKAFLAEPNITTSPKFLGGGVMENSSVEFSCIANTDSDKNGAITWGIHRGETEVDVVDDWVKSTKHIDGTGECGKKIESRLRLVVTRKDQGLTVSCSFSHQDVAPASGQQKDCRINKLCVQSEKLRVLYPVLETSMRVMRLPQDGGGVTLECRIESLPEASISWSRDNRIFPGEMSANGVNQWVLKDPSSLKDEGVHNCAARNTIFNTTYSVAKEIKVLAGKLPVHEKEGMTLLSKASMFAFYLFWALIVLVIIYTVFYKYVWRGK